jgi:hypothetical protein
MLWYCFDISWVRGGVFAYSHGCKWVGGWR